MRKFSFVCSYCGNRWKEELWSDAALEKARVCKICREVKNVVVKQPLENESESDCFGYRFSPPFPEKENVEVKPWYL